MSQVVWGEFSLGIFRPKKRTTEKFAASNFPVVFKAMVQATETSQCRTFRKVHPTVPQSRVGGVCFGFRIGLVLPLACWVQFRIGAMFRTTARNHPSWLNCGSSNCSSYNSLAIY
jgi:hypothetical protein